MRSIPEIELGPILPEKRILRALALIVLHIRALSAIAPCIELDGYCTLSHALYMRYLPDDGIIGNRRSTWSGRRSRRKGAEDDRATSPPRPKIGGGLCAHGRERATNARESHCAVRTADGPRDVLQDVPHANILFGQVLRVDGLPHDERVFTHEENARRVAKTPPSLDH